MTDKKINFDKPPRRAITARHPSKGGKPNILIINGNPNDKSLDAAIAKSYVDGAKSAGARATILHIGKLRFNPDLHNGYNKIMPLEPDLLRAQELIRAANHIVFVFPTWFGTYPALLAGFVQRAWLPGFAFHYTDKPLPDGLLAGKTGRVITTMGGPKFAYKLIYRMPGVRGIRDGVMKFAGIRHIKITLFDRVEKRDKMFYEQLLNRAHKIGASDAKK